VILRRMPADRGTGCLAEALGLIADTVTLVLVDEDSELSEESREKLSALARHLNSAAANLTPQVPEDAEVGDTDGIEHLRIATNVEATLRRAGVVVVEQLRAMSDERLLSIRGVGPATRDMVRWAVEDHAMRWWDQPAGRIVRRSDDPFPRWWEREYPPRLRVA
jgi:hypothetical protein